MPAVFISADMEGCATIVHWDEVRPGDRPEYQRACRIFTDEVNAVALGAFEGGAQRVVVNDAHSFMRNLIPDRLDPRIEVISGRFKPHYMLQGLSAGEFSAAFFLGYHGAIGDGAAVMGHTYSPRVIFEMRLNGEVVGELSINAALAGYFGVPVTLVSGDATTLAEARRNIPWAQSVHTKESMSYYAAECLSPQMVCDRLHKAGKLAASGQTGAQLYRLMAPISLELDTRWTSQADAMEWAPGFERIADRTIRYTADDMLDVYRAMMAAIYLGVAAEA